MASDEEQWIATLTAARVPVGVRTALVADGYVVPGIFVEAFDEAASLNSWLHEQLHEKAVLGEAVEPAKVSRHAASSALRGVWKRLKDAELAQAAKASGANSECADSKDTAISLKRKAQALGDDEWKEYKDKFSANYPHEVTTKRRLPARGLVSAFAAMNKGGRDFKYVPWEQYISLLAEEKKAAAAGPPSARRKLDFSDELGLHFVEELCADKASAAPFSCSASVAERVLEIRARAFAMANHCKLLTMRLYNEALLEYHFEEQVDSSQRSPTMAELVCADKKAMETAFALVGEQGWSLDRAVGYVAAPGGVLSRSLGPRAKGAVFADLKAKGGSKGEGASSDREAKKQDGRVDKRNWAKKHDSGRLFCFRKHLKGDCPKKDCGFAHSCPLMIKGKGVCGGMHAAARCPVWRP
jgi:hypothetical protein